MNEKMKNETRYIIIASILFLVSLLILALGIKFNFAPTKNIVVVEGFNNPCNNRMEIYCGNDTSGQNSWACDVSLEQYNFITNTLKNNTNKNNCTIKVTGVIK